MKTNGSTGDISISHGKRDGQPPEGEAIRLPNDAPFVERCKRLAQARIHESSSRLFQDQTKFRLNVIWMPQGALHWVEVPPVFCTTGCMDHIRETRGGEGCSKFDHTQLGKVLSASAKGHGFVCPFHIRTFAQVIQVGDLCLGVAFFQTQDARGRSDRNASQSSNTDRHSYQQARRLLQFVIHDAAGSVLAEIEREWILRLQEELSVTRQTEDSLRSVFHQIAPAGGSPPGPTGFLNHEDNLVKHMVDYANNLYGRPISLGEFAARAGMNLSYLSHLFSTNMGLSFRTYLKQLRLDRARGLLADPFQRISDVAYAVGYTDPNRFRLDFKNQTGMAPSQWRERFAAAPEAGLP